MFGSTSRSRMCAREAPARLGGGDVVEVAHLHRGGARHHGEAVPQQQAEGQHHHGQRTADQRRPRSSATRISGIDSRQVMTNITDVVHPAAEIAAEHAERDADQARGDHRQRCRSASRCARHRSAATGSRGRAGRCRTGVRTSRPAIQAGGIRRRIRSCANGSCGASSGAKIATSSTPPTMSAPTPSRSRVGESARHRITAAHAARSRGSSTAFISVGQQRQTDVDASPASARPPAPPGSRSC